MAKQMSAEVIGNDDLMESHACSKGQSDGSSNIAKQRALAF